MGYALQIGQVEGDNPEEIKKQKAIKGLLNKITPEKFDKILADIIAVGYETEETESGLINQVYTTMQSPLAQISCRFIDRVRSEHEKGVIPAHAELTCFLSAI